MISIDTCHDCQDRNRYCDNCGGNRLAKVWLEGNCPECKLGGDISAKPTVNSKIIRPNIIDHLSALGWLLLILAICTAFIVSKQMSVIFAALIIASGIIQLLILLGLSEVIDQLYKINVNTSKPDK